MSDTTPNGGQGADHVDLLRRFVDNDTYWMQHRKACQDDPCLTCEGFAFHEEGLYDEARAAVAAANSPSPLGGYERSSEK